MKSEFPKKETQIDNELSVDEAKELRDLRVWWSDANHEESCEQHDAQELRDLRVWWQAAASQDWACPNEACACRGPRTDDTPARLDADGTAVPLTQLKGIVSAEDAERLVINPNQIQGYILANNYIGTFGEPRTADAQPLPGSLAWAEDEIRRERARLDPEGTAKGKTRIVTTGYEQDPGSTVARGAVIPPGDTYVAEDGTRIPLTSGPNAGVTRDESTPENKAFWDGVRKSAEGVKGQPAWTGAGINLNPKNFETYAPESTPTPSKAHCYRDPAATGGCLGPDCCTCECYVCQDPNGPPPAARSSRPAEKPICEVCGEEDSDERVYGKVEVCRLCLASAEYRVEQLTFIIQRFIDGGRLEELLQACDNAGLRPKAAPFTSVAEKKT